MIDNKDNLRKACEALSKRKEVLACEYLQKKKIFGVHSDLNEMAKFKSKVQK